METKLYFYRVTKPFKGNPIRQCKECLCNETEKRFRSLEGDLPYQYVSVMNKEKIGIVQRTYHLGEYILILREKDDQFAMSAILKEASNDYNAIEDKLKGLDDVIKCIIAPIDNKEITDAENE